METSLYYRILQSAYETGIGEIANIKPILLNKLGHKNSEKEWSTKWNMIITVTNSMDSNNHIKYVDRAEINLDLLIKAETPLNIRLTYIGAEYYNNYLLAIATRDGFKNQSLYNRITAYILAASVLASIGATIYYNTLSQEVQKVQLEVKRLIEAGRPLPGHTPKNEKK